MRLPAVLLLTVLALGGAAVQARPAPSWPAGLPVYDHVVIVIEENKDYREIVGNPRAPYLNDVLLREGASFTRMYAEEHNSEGNYFWLFSGSNQGVGFEDRVPSAAVRADYPLTAPNLASELIAAGRTFAGYAEGLPAPGSTAVLAGTYARKHVPYISFGNVPAACNQPFTAFPAEGHFDQLPTVAFVLPDLDDDMHNCVPPTCASPDLGCCIAKGDAWLRTHLDAYLRWARTHNSLLILTFDESDDRTGYAGLTNPAMAPGVLKPCRSADSLQLLQDIQNRIVTIAAGAHIRPGQYPEGRGITHVNLLRTLEAMYGLPRAGAQQPNAAAWGLSGDTIITDIFQPQEARH
ncbi:MAG: acid phosphatase [Acidobacteriota bacterium]|nr:acid phosphatase [Acidobacteriota bacterium]